MEPSLRSSNPNVGRSLPSVPTGQPPQTSAPSIPLPQLPLKMSNSGSHNEYQNNPEKKVESCRSALFSLSPVSASRGSFIAMNENNDGAGSIDKTEEEKIKMENNDGAGSIDKTEEEKIKMENNDGAGSIDKTEEKKIEKEIKKENRGYSKGLEEKNTYIKKKIGPKQYNKMKNRGRQATLGALQELIYGPNSPIGEADRKLLEDACVSELIKLKWHGSLAVREWVRKDPEVEEGSVEEGSVEEGSVEEEDSELKKDSEVEEGSVEEEDSKLKDSLRAFFKKDKEEVKNKKNNEEIEKAIAEAMENLKYHSNPKVRSLYIEARKQGEGVENDYLNDLKEVDGKRVDGNAICIEANKRGDKAKDKYINTYESSLGKVKRVGDRILEGLKYTGRVMKESKRDVSTIMKIAPLKKKILIGTAVGAVLAIAIIATVATIIISHGHSSPATPLIATVTAKTTVTISTTILGKFPVTAAAAAKAAAAAAAAAKAAAAAAAAKTVAVPVAVAAKPVVVAPLTSLLGLTGTTLKAALGTIAGAISTVAIACIAGKMYNKRKQGGANKEIYTGD
jgi:hypothetical protein